MVIKIDSEVACGYIYLINQDIFLSLDRAGFTNEKILITLVIATILTLVLLAVRSEPLSVPSPTPTDW